MSYTSCAWRCNVGRVGTGTLIANLPLVKKVREYKNILCETYPKHKHVYEYSPPTVQPFQVRCLPQHDKQVVDTVVPDACLKFPHVCGRHGAAEPDLLYSVLVFWTRRRSSLNKLGIPHCRKPHNATSETHVDAIVASLSSAAGHLVAPLPLMQGAQHTDWYLCVGKLSCCFNSRWWQKEDMVPQFRGKCRIPWP